MAPKIICILRELAPKPITTEFSDPHECPRTFRIFGKRYVQRDDRYWIGLGRQPITKNGKE